MSTSGIDAVFLETHNWGKSVRFFQALGYKLEFETDHNSGMLRNGDGPYLFISEVPENRATGTQIVFKADEGFEPAPELEVVSPFEDTHYGTTEMTVRDPDGRTWIVQKPGKG
ncbi:VOC family protein [Actinocrispum sp. NPDC049592]|uniref:VOC family protein n=1 Tax=Actinocrispum sp. NPDC049592 TaxID=3154835 RepID=UPI00342758A3